MVKGLIWKEVSFIETLKAKIINYTLYMIMMVLSFGDRFMMLKILFIIIYLEYNNHVYNEILFVMYEY